MARKKASSWFDVSKDGLKQLMEGRPKSFIIRELVQNAWDEPGVTVCNITLRYAGRGIADMEVVDDAPEGFADITHAYTLFAETRKRKDPTKRGRFNLGEKQVLALCKEASIRTTTGTIEFCEDGTRKSTRGRTTSGSVFAAKIRMKKAEVKECIDAISSFLPPGSVNTIINGRTLKVREPVRSAKVRLTTEYTTNSGSWRRGRRNTVIDVVATARNEVPTLYEMGIPVVELEGGDKYHYNVNQRVPLNQDRDNVSPAYLRDLRAEVLNVVADMLTESDASEAWVREASETKRVSEEAFDAVMTKRFGKKVAKHTIGDKEANHNAVAHGYTVLSGGALSKGEWANVKKFDTVPSTAKVCPTDRPTFDGENAGKLIPEDEWTEGMRRVVRLTHDIAEETIGGCVVRIARSPQKFAAWYGGRELTFNYRKLGRRFFNSFPDNRADVVGLIIHELAHEAESNHLSDKYHREVCRLAGEVVELSLRRSEVFDDEAVLA